MPRAINPTSRSCACTGLAKRCGSGCPHGSTYADVSYLFILSAAGALLHRVVLHGRGSMAAPTVDDVDGDDVLEIVVSLKDHLGNGLGGEQIWDVASASGGTREWPTGRGNYLRTGTGDQP